MTLPKSLVSVQELIFQKKLTVLDITKIYLDKINKSKTNAFIETFDDEALLKANEIDLKIKNNT